MRICFSNIIQPLLWTIILGGLPLLLNAQDATEIVGTVRDSASDQTLIGVHIQNLTSSEGVVTDFDGEFIIEAGEGHILQFSYLGYKTKQIEVKTDQRMEVLLAQDILALDEVVVVGYGTQRVENVTGSISSINFNENIESRPTMDLASTLIGLSPGLVISQTTATPGSEGYNILVRGLGTMNDASPLVLVDGIPGALNDVNPNDVQNVSVLKDASASAIYGSRAANGVILVTTKKGVQGQSFKINYNGYVGLESASHQISFIDDMATHMELVNEAEGFEKYPQNLINTWRQESTAGNPLYPNTDWYNEMLKNSVLNEHNLSVRGGFENGSLALSLGYLDNQGIIENSGYKKYDIRVSANTQIRDRIEIGGDLFGIWTEAQPLSVSSFFASIRNTTPGVIPELDGQYGGEMFEGLPPGSNPRAYVDNVYGNSERQRVGVKAYTNIDLFQNLSWETSFGLNYRNRLNWQYARPISLVNFQTGFEYPERPNINSLSQVNRRDYSYILNSLLRYNSTIKQHHHLGLLLGIDQQYNKMDQFGATKNDLIGDAILFVLNAGANLESITGTATDDALRSYFGRVNYNFKEKYLFEFNARYDGSSRFAKENRWGFFPSFSAGWRILEEPFAQPLEDVFSEIKLRGSWGKLGNNRIGDYTYQTTYGSFLYPFGGHLQQGLAPTDLANESIKWETTTIANVGLDVTLLQNKWTFGIEYFNKITDDILTKIPIPLVMGNFAPPWQNIARMKNEGVELQVRHINQINQDLSYQINGNFSSVNNTVLDFNGEKSISGPTIIQEGSPYASFYALEFDRIIQTQSEIDQLLEQGYTFGAYVGGVPMPGDILYKDVNGDKVFNEEDRVVKDYSALPKFTYGLSLSLAYKKMDFSIVGHGKSGFRQYWGNDGFNTFNINEGFLLREEVLNRWTPENQSTDFPRLRTSGSALNTAYSDYWLHNTSYFKINSIQFGYTIMDSSSSLLKIDKLRLYANLENFFTFTSFDGYNPDNAGVSYPLMKQLVFGLNLTF